MPDLSDATELRRAFQAHAKLSQQLLVSTEREAATFALELSEQRLEVELCHRSLAHLNLKLNTTTEDLKDLQVRPRFLTLNCPCALHGSLLARCSCVKSA